MYPQRVVGSHEPQRGEQHFGLDCWDGQPFLMHDMHWHPEVELNYVVEGDVTYLAGGQLATLGAGQLAVFWGALPHRVVLAHPATEMCWLTLPLPAVLAWNLSGTFTHALLHGAFLTQDVGSLAPTIRLAFAQWADDLAAGRAKIALLEVEARVRRLAAVVQPQGKPPLPLPVGNLRLKHVQGLVSLIAENYAKPLTVAALARQVGLHPHYAMTVFKATLGISLQTYLTQHRIAHAQRLLATSALPILDVAFSCGFTSTSQFYELFKRSSGLTPRQYRQQSLAAQGEEPGPARSLGAGR